MEKFICDSCIEEPFLQNLIALEGIKTKCSYCNTVGMTFDLQGLSKRVHRVFQNFYIATNSEPEDWQYALLKDKESNYEWDRGGDRVEDIVCDILQTHENIAKDITELLGSDYYDFELAKMGVESPYSKESRYEQRILSGREFKNKWAKFEASIKSSSRFFGHYEFLNEIFKDLNQLAKERHEKLIREIGPEKDITKIYRARIVHQVEVENAFSKPELSLGPPPQNKSKAGRMNALGIAALYGALSDDTAVSEIRPPAGAHVIVGCFDIIRPLRVLDIEALKSIEVEGSMFDSKYFEDLELSNFLKQLSSRLSKPVMPDDEPFEYLATQAVSDFLSSSKELDIHGIIYPSVYRGGKDKNIVIFSDSVVIEKNQNVTTFHPPSDGEEGTDMFDNFTILEEQEIEPNSKFELEWDEIHERYRTPKKPTLRLDRDSLRLCMIESVEVKLKKEEIARQIVKVPSSPKPIF